LIHYFINPGKMYRFNVILLFSIIVHPALAQEQHFRAADLRTEYLHNPLGIDCPQPRFTWRLNDARHGARQTSYRVIVDTDSLALVADRAGIWSSGWVESGDTRVIYTGPQLNPFTRYYWRVDVADHDRTKTAKGAIAWFETGMRTVSNWQGAWISDEHNEHQKAAPYFRKEFRASKKIRSAKVYIAAAGLFELYMNGKKIGDHVLDPMYTRFDRRILYIAHDVTRQVQNGDNALGVLLGNGWYNHQSTAVWNFHTAPWRARPAFCLDLRITYDDGSIETITSGKGWKTSLSPVIFNSIYTAEHYDARQEQPGWNAPGFNENNWKDVIYRQAPAEQIVSQTMHPVRHVEEIPARSFRKLNDTTYIFDLGRNIAGVTKLRIHGAAGTTVRLKHGERLAANGHVDQSNIDAHYRPVGTSDPFQTDIYTLRGTSAEEEFMPRFNYKGFQYIEVSSRVPITLNQQSITGYFMHSDVPVAGRIRSSNPVIDKIWYATNNSYLSNLFGYPTDCPQREKNGWTGDAQIAIETGLYGFDGITVYEKWMADHRDEQQPNGVLPSIIPSNGWGYEWGNGPDWTSTIAIIPWNIYLFYGDTRILADCYDNMTRYINHISALYPTGLTTWGLGDWVPVKSKSPVELTSTCYYYADAVIAAKVAHILGHKEDHVKYTALAAKIRDAFNTKYLHVKTGIYNTGLQTELSAPLFWGLVPDSLRPMVAANLAKRVEADQFHLDVGLLGQKAILSALSENGYADIAYRVAAQETYPSWGWWIRNGATTLYENWNIQAEHDISLNHIMFGEIGAWLYKGIGGIKPDPEKPGFKNIILQPNFVSGLNQFEATHNGPQGTIVSSWKRDGKRITYTVVVPANAEATVYLPEVSKRKVYMDKREITASPQQLKAGTYTFLWK
jgi:alpha-L-rhamnosidase